MSIFCSFSTLVPCNCHPCCGVCQQVLGSSSGLFPALALYESVQKGLCQPGELFHAVSGVGFLFPSSVTWQLTSSCSCFPSILCASNGYTWLSHFPDTPLSVPQSWCSGIPYPHRTVSVWSYQNCPSEFLGFAIYKCLELSGVRFQKS